MSVVLLVFLIIVSFVLIAAVVMMIIVGTSTPCVDLYTNTTEDVSSKTFHPKIPYYRSLLDSFIPKTLQATKDEPSAKSMEYSSMWVQKVYYELWLISIWKHMNETQRKSALERLDYLHSKLIEKKVDILNKISNYFLLEEDKKEEDLDKLIASFTADDKEIEAWQLYKQYMENIIKYHNLNMYFEEIIYLDHLLNLEKRIIKNE